MVFWPARVPVLSATGSLCRGSAEWETLFMIRPFDWRDLPTLHRYRQQGLCLDSALGLTRGQTLSPSVLLSYLTPTTGFYTWVNPDEEQPVLGQLSHQPTSPYARVSFLAPEKAIKRAEMGEILDHLARQAGQRGATHLLAEVDEFTPAFEVLRRAGFGIFARQRIWKVRGESANKPPQVQWRPVKDLDVIAVQSLFHNVVPGLVGQVEPLDPKNLQGLVCYQNQELAGYVSLKYGHRGIWAKPFFHPDVENVTEQLQSMIHSIPDRRSRPIYVCVRTYLSWLEPSLSAMDTRPSPLQAVMVKRLAIRQKVARRALPSMEGQQEVTAPLAQARRNDELAVDGDLRR